MLNLPTYRIIPSAHPVKCPPQCPSPSHPHPLPTSPSTTPSSFPRVKSLSCSVSLSDISHSFLLPSLLFPFTIIYIPQMNETIIKGKGEKNEWEKSERETEHERLLTLGNELGVVEREVGRGWGWLGDGHWGGPLKGWALAVILYVGKLNTN